LENAAPSPGSSKRVSKKAFVLAVSLTSKSSSSNRVHRESPRRRRFRIEQDGRLVPVVKSGSSNARRPLENGQLCAIAQWGLTGMLETALLRRQQATPQGSVARATAPSPPIVVVLGTLRVERDDAVKAVEPIAANRH